MIDMEKWLKEYKEERSINCPYCGEVHLPEGDNLVGLVTYWGEEDPIEFQCINCEKSFWVNEKVTRIFKEGKTVDEALEN